MLDTYTVAGSNPTPDTKNTKRIAGPGPALGASKNHVARICKTPWTMYTCGGKYNVKEQYAIELLLDNGMLAVKSTE
jgi:hypothetical protein